MNYIPQAATAAVNSSARGRLNNGDPNPVDIHVGSRMRLRRTLLGMTQEKLGDALGLTFQQVQKYERGHNRVSASRLYDLARVLDVPVSFFFDDMPEAVQAASPARVIEAGGIDAADVPAFKKDPAARRETLELIRAYYAIPTPAARRGVYDLVKSMAGPEAGSGAQ